MSTEKSYMEIVNDFCPIEAELRLPPYFHHLLELCNELSANSFPQSTNQRPFQDGHAPEHRSVMGSHKPGTALQLQPAGESTK